MDKIEITVSGVHEDAGEQATMKFDGITRDDASRMVIFELPWHEGLGLKTYFEAGNDVIVSVTPDNILRDLTLEHAAKEATAAFRGDHILATHDPDDSRILQQIQVLAQKVAVHDHALTPFGRPDDDRQMMQIAQERRGAEEELNRLLTNRVNKLANQIRSIL